MIIEKVCKSISVQANGLWHNNHNHLYIDGVPFEKHITSIDFNVSVQGITSCRVACYMDDMDQIEEYNYTVLHDNNGKDIKDFNMAMGLRLAVQYIHGWAKDQGWWTDLKTGSIKERNKGELIALMHSELSECLEGVRKGLKDDHLPHLPMETVELADLFIRMCDYCGGFGLNLPRAVVEKLRYNMEREDHKIEHRQKENGKKF